jgi:hypothetical protein
VTSSFSFAVSLMGSLVLAAPTLVGFLRGDIAPDVACIRYVLAFALAKLGVGVVNHLLVDYLAEAHRRAYLSLQAAAEEPAP